MVAQETRLPKLLLSIVILLVVLGVLILAFAAIGNKDSGIPTAVNAVLVLIVGIGGIWAFYWSGNNVAEQSGEQNRNKVVAYFYVFPAIFILGVYLVYPAVRTIILSFFDRTGDSFVGLQNYAFLFSNPKMLVTLRNTLLWVLVVPSVTVSLGLVIAVLVDKLHPTTEKSSKLLFSCPWRSHSSVPALFSASYITRPRSAMKSEF